MPNATKPKPKKSPWIPPPGRTNSGCHKTKTVGKTVEIIPTVVVCDTTKDVRNSDGDTSDMVSVSSSSSHSRTPCPFNAHLNSVKQEMEFFSVHFATLKEMSRFLNDNFKTTGIRDRTLTTSLSKVDVRIKDFIFEFDELEFSVAFVENTLHETNKIEEFCKMIKLKEALLSKILECYSIITVIFQKVIQKQITEDVAKFQKDHDLLRKQLELSQNKCHSQEAVITDLERRISILQGKTNTMESYKTTLEEARTELQKHLADKDNQIKFLMAEVSRLDINRQKKDGCEKLLEDGCEKLVETIEGMKKTAHAEKTVLKKALKVEKFTVTQKEKSIEKLKKEIKEKEDMLFDIASQRDKLKLSLTSANNRIIESKNEIEELKSQNLKLQNELLEKESNVKKQLKRTSDELKENTERLDDLIAENSKLKRTIKTLKDDLETKEEELSALKSRLSDARTNPPQNRRDENGENVHDEMKQLMLLLKDTKECMENIQKMRNVPGGDNVQEGKGKDSFHLILTAIEEIKNNLLEMKNVYDIFPKGDAEKMKLEKEFKELQQLYSLSAKENNALKSEIEELKNSGVHNSPLLQAGNYSMGFGSDSQLSVKNLQIELNLKTEENRRLKQRERDLEYQLEEVKEKLQRKEIENVKLFSLEEELKSKKLEERKRDEEMERLLLRVKELQESLDKKASENDNLLRHVEALKCSFANVFGNSGYFHGV